MSDQFLGEIRLFAGNYAPEGWHFCDGALLSISSYNTLYALLGTIYGGDGVSTFGVPDLRGRVPIHQGTGSGLSQRTLGSKIGTEQVALTVSDQLPDHTHVMYASNAPASSVALNNLVLAKTPSVDNFYIPKPADTTKIITMLSDGPNGSSNVSYVGGNAPHDNVMPFLALNYIIATTGYFPQQQ